MEQETVNNETKFQSKYIIILLIIIILLVGAMYLLNKILNNKEDKPTNLTLDEKIVYTLKNRYNREFTKDSKTTYKDSNGIVFAVETKEINNEKTIIFDDYLNAVQTNKISNKISNILSNNGINGATVKLSPAKDCRFIGSCVSNEYYYKNYIDNTDDTALAKRSDEIKLSEYLNLSNSDYFNKVGFYLYIKIIGDYDYTNKENIKNALINLFDQLNDSGYKNSLGYEIEVKKSDGITDVMKLKADNNNKLFSINDAKES